MARIRLTDIIDAIEMQFEEISSFLNLETGEVETVSHEVLRARMAKILKLLLNEQHCANGRSRLVWALSRCWRERVPEHH